MNRATLARAFRLSEAATVQPGTSIGNQTGTPTTQFGIPLLMAAINPYHLLDDTFFTVNPSPAHRS